MAIDSENKRRSARSMLIGLVIAPVPDGGLAGVDRRHAAGLYASFVTNEVLMVATSGLQFGAVGRLSIPTEKFMSASSAMAFSATGTLKRGGVVSGIDEGISNEYAFPPIPDEFTEAEREFAEAVKVLLDQVNFPPREAVEGTF